VTPRAVMAPQPGGSCLGGRSLAVVANLDGVLALPNQTDQNTNALARQDALLGSLRTSDGEQQSAIERVVAGLERVEEGSRSGPLALRPGESRSVGVGDLRVRFTCEEDPEGRGRPSFTGRPTSSVAASATPSRPARPQRPPCRSASPACGRAP
jgi:hypothetical protein